MRYTYEYKRKCVELYREGKWPETPEGVSDKSFRDKVAVDVASLTVAGGTITIIGGDGGDGGRGGFYTATGVYGVGGDGGNGGAAITDNTKVYLNGGRLNVTAGRGGNPGTNTNVPAEQQDNYKSCAWWRTRCG